MPPKLVKKFFQYSEHHPSVIGLAERNLGHAACILVVSQCSYMLFLNDKTGWKNHPSGLTLSNIRAFLLRGIVRISAYVAWFFDLP